MTLILKLERQNEFKFTKKIGIGLLKFTGAAVATFFVTDFYMKTYSGKFGIIRLGLETHKRMCCHGVALATSALLYFKPTFLDWQIPMINYHLTIKSHSLPFYAALGAIATSPTWINCEFGRKELLYFFNSMYALGAVCASALLYKLPSVITPQTPQYHICNIAIAALLVIPTVGSAVFHNLSERAKPAGENYMEDENSATKGIIMKGSKVNYKYESIVTFIAGASCLLAAGLNACRT